MERKTIFSEGRIFRYTLWREWDLANQTFCQVIGLNPSTADETADDNTVRRCVQYAKDWGYGALCMTNIFAYRATDPRKMKEYPFPVGEENNHWLVTCAREAGIVIAAWGNHGLFMRRGEAVAGLIRPLHCLGITKQRQPEHPLYLAKTRVPILYMPV